MSATTLTAPTRTKRSSSRNPAVKNTGTWNVVDMSPKTLIDFEEYLDATVHGKKVVVHATFKFNPVAGSISDFKILGIVEKPTEFDEAAFTEAVEEGTKLWADVPDHVAWVREMRGLS